MTLKLSTGLRNKMLGLQATPVAVLTNTSTGTTLAYADGGASADTITRLAGSFVTDGFAPGQKITTVGSTTAGNDLTNITLTSVAALTLSFATASLVGDTSENFAAGTALTAAEGGSFKDIFRDGTIRVYSGSQPADADTAVSGTLLLEFSVDAGSYTQGTFTNGLEFGDSSSGAISKSASETWQDAGIASGTAGWFRLCANPTDDGSASTTLPRIDGTVGTTSSSELVIGTTAIVAGRTYTIDTFTFTLPEYYGA